jgi:hypothetical protein
MPLAFFIDHWFHFFFWGGNPSPTNVWYERAVWGNVVAVFPLAALGLVGYLWHRGVMKEAHEKLDRLAAVHAAHTAHLKQLLDALDPETDGGLGDLRDLLDVATPGGIGALREQLDDLKMHLVHNGPEGQAEPAVEPPSGG